MGCDAPRPVVLSLCPHRLRHFPIVSYVAGRGEGFASDPGVLGIDAWARIADGAITSEKGLIEAADVGSVF